MKYWLLLLPLTILPASVHAQTDAQNAVSEIQFADDLHDLSESFSALAEPSPTVTAEQLNSAPEEVRKAYEKAVIRHYEHQVWQRDHRERIYGFQFWGGLVVFLVAISIVVCGLAMSWIQFKNSSHYASAAENASEAKDETQPQPAHPPEQHRIEIGLNKAVVATSVVGLVVLTLSLAFFYLYLKFVFVIS